MAIKGLTQEQVYIAHLVCTTGCMTKEQVYYTFQYIEPAVLDKMIDILAKKNKVKVVDNFVIVPPIEENTFERYKMSCMWAFLTKLKRESTKSLSEILTVNKPYPPMTMAFIQNAQLERFLLFCDESSVTVNIRQAEKQYNTTYDGDAKGSVKYSFVIENKDLIDAIQSNDIEIPHEIIWVDYKNIREKPDIYLLGKQ